MLTKNKNIVLCAPKRTPFAQLSKGLSDYDSYELGFAVADTVCKVVGKGNIDGIIVGEGFPQQPNAARVISNLLKLEDSLPALTVNNNCVSALEAVAEAMRRIELEEGNGYLCIGEESLTRMPFIISGARQNKKTATLEKLKKQLTDLPEGIAIRDTLEEGLGDSMTSFGMHVTAELVAQKLEITRELSDHIAYESYRRASKATEQGVYRPYLVEMKTKEGNPLQDDEAVILRKKLVENPQRLKKAMLLFDNPQYAFAEFVKSYSPKKSHGATVSIFNACPRSDGACGAFIASKERATELGLQPLAYIEGFGFQGVDPNYMGLGQAAASLALLKESNTNLADLDYIEIHEAFAATAIGALKEMSAPFDFDWQTFFDQGNINAYGGSIALGHPFGATGLRLLTNVGIRFAEQKENCKRALVTACAHGGIAGAMLLRNPNLD